MPLADYQSRVDDLVRAQEGNISDDQRDRAIDDAVTEYARHQTHTRVRLTAVQDTIPAQDRGAICGYAAALLLQQLAAARAGDTDSTINADSVDHGAATDRYRRLAHQLRQRFYEHLGVTPDKPSPASAVVDIDLPSARGHDRITHSHVYR